METLPKIDGDEILRARNSWDYLSLIADKYFKMINADEDIAKEFNSSQHTLLAFYYLQAEVCNGGFIQLIQNGYGKYIFGNQLEQNMKIWGAEKIAQIIEKARVIYEEHKSELERELTLDEYSELYEKFTDFEDLEAEYYKVTDSETDIIKNYVESNINHFVTII